MWLVRYLAQDDPARLRRATRPDRNRVVGGRPRFHQRVVVLVELCWVLKRLYSATPRVGGYRGRNLLAGAQFHVDQRDAVENQRSAPADALAANPICPDVLIEQIARAFLGCTETVTFDRKTARGLACLCWPSDSPSHFGF